MSREARVVSRDGKVVQLIRLEEAINNRLDSRHLMQVPQIWDTMQLIIGKQWHATTICGSLIITTRRICWGILGIRASISKDREVFITPVLN